MLRRVVVCALVLVGVSLVHGLKCRSGINASIAGVPFHQWYEDTCSDNSKCFGHEILVSVQSLDVAIQYGGCISNAYSTLISCESLFGQASESNPTDLLDVIPHFDQKVQSFVQHFTKNVTANLQSLFTAGHNNQEFINGFFKLYENLGFNIDKLKPLEAPLGKLLSAAFTQMNDPRQIQTAISELFTVIAALDTSNPEITEDLYSFFHTLGVEKSSIQSTPYADLFEKLPGLLLSTLPAKFEPNRWYGVIFKLLSKVNPRSPLQTTKDMTAIIKATDWVPAEYKTYTDKFLDRLPELVEQLANGNASYPPYWSTLLLKDYSEETTATTKLSNAVTSVLQKFGISNLPRPIQMVIEYLPGHFYNYFPDKRAEMDKVYKQIADGLQSIDLSTMLSKKPETTMSEFLNSLIIKTVPAQVQISIKPLAIEFADMFYKLMEPDYGDKLDIFFTTLTEGFKDYPSVNAGKIVRNLVVNLGGIVPTEVEPLLTNLQNVVSTLVPELNFKLLVQELRNLINAYEKAFPESLFPAVFRDSIDYYIYLFTFNYVTATPEELSNFTLHSQLKAQYVGIDLQFALVQVLNLTSKQIESLLTSSFPDFGLFIKSLTVLEPADIKQLTKDVITWMVKATQKNPPSLTSQGFIDAVKPTMMKLTKKLGDVVKDYRRVFSPNSCKSAFCAEDNCNTNIKIMSKQPVTKAFLQAKISPVTTTTPSSSRRIAYSSLLVGFLLGILKSVQI